jgi:hypothetical protein
MPCVLAARNEAAAEYHSLVRTDELHEEEHIVDFLCGLLGVILLWLRNRLGLGKDVARPADYDQLRAAGHSFERPCDDTDVEAILGRLRAAMTVDSQELASCFPGAARMPANSQCPRPGCPDHRRFPG